MEPTASEGASPDRLSAYLRRERQRILGLWMERVRHLDSARRLTRTELLDHLPQLLERIALIAEDLEAGRPLRDTGADPLTHAVERLREGVELEDVVREFCVLRDCILELWAHGQDAGTALVNQAIDEAVRVSVRRYLAARERTLIALDRIATAAFTIEKLDPFLRSLAEVLLQTTDAVDSVAVCLREGDRICVRAAVGLEEGRTSEPCADLASDTCAGIIARTGKPLELREAASDPRVREVLRKAGVRAYYGVPLLRRDVVIGVAHMASRTAFEFATEDKLLFRTMVGRASSAVAKRQFHEALEAERRRLRTVLDVLPVGVWIADRDGALVEANAAAREIWGDPGAVSSIEDYARFRASTADTHAPLAPEEWGIARALRSGEVVRDQEVDVETFRGERRTLLNSAAPIRNADGEITGAVAVNVDITHGKNEARERQALHARAEQALATAQKERAVIEALFSGLPVGVALIDREKRYVRVNETLAQLNGVPAAAHVGRRVTEVLGDEGPFLEGLLERVMATGTPLLGQELRNAPRFDPGRVHHFVLNYYPVRLPDGAIIGTGAAVVDVTDRVRLLDEAQQAIRARDEFLSIASHDLRSPLTSLGLQADTILRRLNGFDKLSLPAEWLRPKVQAVARNVERIQGLLDDLLDVSRMQAGRLSLHLEEVDLAAVVRDVASRLEPLFLEAGCALLVSADEAVVGRWDRLRLEQVVTNLMTNAAKYGKGNPVEVSALGEGDTARLVVRDHGIGIPVEHRESIFQRFERAVGDRSQIKGAGLGLWIVRRIVEALGGGITLDSEVAKGSTFTVVLPRGGASDTEGER